MNCITSHIDLFSRTENLENKIFEQDIIFVGGGNTKSMIAVWKEWKLHIILRKAYEKGIVMSGVSAGAICWFEKGISDSFAEELKIIDCLGIIRGVACPHFDEEKDREPFVSYLLKNNIIKNCICIEGNSALHIKDDFNFSSIDFRKEGKKSYIFYNKNDVLKKNIFEERVF